MKKKIYQLHRSLSIIIAIPVFLWASSGFMHPLMTTIRPAIVTQGWTPAVVDSSRLRVPLSAALHKHHLDSFANVRLVHIDTNWFYQVQPAIRARLDAGTASLGTSPAIQPAVPVYLSCTNGNVLPAGDWLYAQYLARHFLEGEEPRHAETSTPATTSTVAITTPGTTAIRASTASIPAAETVPDCCGAATECVLNPLRGSKVTNVSLLTSYDKEYKSINRLLPVYRVSFDRPDGIRVYVETTQDRFSFAMDNKRAVFDEIFRLFHTWGWIEFLGKGRLAVELSFAFLAFCTAVLGIYLFFSTRAAKGKKNPLVRARRYHRYTAIFASLFTLFWSFSGSYHAFSKLIGDETPPIPIPGNFAAADASFDYSRLLTAAGHPITTISLARIGGLNYWRVSTKPEHAPVHKDLMKDGKAAFAPVVYISNTDYSVLPEGDQRYAVSLAGLYSHQPSSAAQSVTPITAFDDEYNFTDKRLPVWRVSYPGAGHPRYYMETSSGQLAAYMDAAAYAEGYSFSVFHKHHFMDWGGKTVRDGSTMFWALAQVLMVSIGLTLYVRYRRRKVNQKKSDVSGKK